MNGEETKTEEAPAAASAESEVAKLGAALEAAVRRADELLDRLRRSQADYENLQKRTAKELEDVRTYANEALLASFLPVLDDFDHAIAALPGEAGAGIRMLHGNLWRVLRDAGLDSLNPAGQPFDPYDHEVVGQTNDEDLKDGIVKEV